MQTQDKSEGGQKIAQWVKYLPCKHAEMSLDPQHPQKEQVSTGEAETRDPLSSLDSQPNEISEC